MEDWEHKLLIFNVGNIVVTTKNTCYFTLPQVWNIDVHNAENSIPVPLDFKIFWGECPQTPLEARTFMFNHLICGQT